MRIHGIDDLMASKRSTPVWCGIGRRVDLRILAGFLLVSLGLFAFAKIASEVMDGDTMAFDRIIIEMLRERHDGTTPIGPHWLLAVMRDLTALGGWTVVTVLTGAVIGYLAIARHTATALFILVSVGIGTLMGTLLKLLFDRRRPDLVAHLVDVNTSSFPSGHAMNSAIVYLTLGALLARAQDSRARRVYVLSLAIALTLAVGLSRVYLGVHWPSDVLGGWIVGASWALLCSLIAWSIQRRS